MTTEEVVEKIRIAFREQIDAEPEWSKAAIKFQFDLAVLKVMGEYRLPEQILSPDPKHRREHLSAPNRLVSDVV